MLLLLIFTSQVKMTENLSSSKVINELRTWEGISVWSADQWSLEQQALKELKILAEDVIREHKDLEEGEVYEKTSEHNGVKDKHFILNISDYLKRQEDLKKRQQYKRALEASESDSNSGNLLHKHSEKKRRLSTTEQSKINANGQVADDENCLSSPEIITETHKLLNTVHKEKNNSGSEYVPSDGEYDSDYEPGYNYNTNEFKGNCEKSCRAKKIAKRQCVEHAKDDGSIQCYKTRLDKYYQAVENANYLKSLSNKHEEIEIEHCTLKGGLKIPINIWSNLYKYQQEGVKWLWKIHQKPTGGILGDEMGLGKTVQMIAFLHALEYSKVSSCSGRYMGIGPSLIVCPATVIHQWVKHFHEWAPEFRVAVLHSSGSFQGNKNHLIKDINKCRGVILTTYIGVIKYKGNLLDYNWHYIILDEGHKIRNPTAKVTIAIKQLRTPHRLLLTGSPMQNNLSELWSLFDFTNPGMLGTLTTFSEHFAHPILQGGFANSTPMQEATALSVATTLKTIITPYLLRRSKAEVQEDILLPNKTEQVLFCSLTDEQKELYKGYLMSEQISTILGRGIKNWFSQNQMRGYVLSGITTLRKICNHPDIYLYDPDDPVPDNKNTPIEERYGYYKRSGKMVVVSALLKIWKKQNHRILLFTQSRAMISIFQDFLEQQGYKYLKMDGTTCVSSRQPLITKFNEDSSYDVFLSTTRVGGLGVNLTGADRVIIYDPDWNPATDTQARERAWRIGQERQVTIYRLLSSGTIEEKMYQRQIWKQLLSNKVLVDPKTQRIFKSSDLHDLFSLQESAECNPETTNIFHESRVKLQEQIKNKSKTNHKKRKGTKCEEPSDVCFSEEKLQAMKTFAKQIAKSLGQETSKDKSNIKTPYQMELEEDREEKLKDKEKLKELTAAELLVYNRKKAKKKVDPTVNKIDDKECNISFASALEQSSKTSKLYHELSSGKIKKSEVNKLKERLKMSRDKEKTVIDKSGRIDGETVEGLVKSETKKLRKKAKVKTYERQNDYVLNKLFSRKGVSGALQHDSIVQTNNRPNNLKIHTEAKQRADRSLEALRKSRLDNWKW